MFWQITPREAMVILEGADARDMTQMRLSQAMVWATAQLVAVGFHNPKNFPKFDKAFPGAKADREPQSDDAIFAAMDRWVAKTELVEASAPKGMD